LKRECEEYSFGVEQTNKSAQNLEECLTNFEKDELSSWNKIFKELFPRRQESTQNQQKCDTIFQMVYNLLHNSSKVSPQSVIISKTVHDLTRSKKLVEMFNHLGICVNYKSLLDIDIAAANRIIAEAGRNRVTVGPSIIPGSIIQGAMDKFDHEENTLSGRFFFFFSFKMVMKKYQVTSLFVLKTCGIID